MTSPLRFDRKTLKMDADTFQCDPSSKRIEKIAPTATTIIAYDGDNLVETTNASDSEVASCTQTRDIDELPAMNAGFRQR